MRSKTKFISGGIISYFTRHPTLANLILVVLLAAGLITAPKMRNQFFPDVVFETVSVNVKWPGAGAEDIDRSIVQFLEPVLMSIEGVDSTSSQSKEGSTSIKLTFDSGWDMSRATDDIQEAVDSVSELPEDAEDPSVRRGGWRDRVADAIISGPVSFEQLGQFADEMVARLFAAGVTKTTVSGFAAPETIVEISSINLIKNDLSMVEIAKAIKSEASTDPAGDVKGSNSRVRTGVAKRTAEQIRSIALRSNPDGSKLLIGDVARVSVGEKNRNRAYFVNKDPAISVTIERSAQGDAIEIQEIVEDVAAELQSILPAQVSIELIRARAEAITGRISILLENGLLGLGLVVLLLFLFLNARTAIWVAAGVPVAMAGAVALMYAAGLTFNMISLFALIITLGIVVDDAIVVGEHADFRFKKLGEDPTTAAENAAKRMASPVFCATITTIIAFFGLVAIGGRFGSLIADIPYTVVVVLLVSFVECFLILPHHMAHALKSASKERWYDFPSRTINRGFEFLKENVFRKLMTLIIRFRYPVIAGALVILCGQAVLLVSGEVKWRFFNSPEQGSISGNFAMLASAKRSDTLEMAEEMQRATSEVALKYEKEFGKSPIEYVLYQVGGNSRRISGQEAKDIDLLGALSIELIDADLRPYSSYKFIADLQDAVRRHPMLEVLSFRNWASGPGSDSLDIRFYGANSEVLKKSAESLKGALLKYPEVSGVEDSLSYDKEELILDLTPQGQALGFSIGDLGQVLRDRLNGIEAVTYPDGVRSAKIKVIIPANELTSSFLESTFLRAQGGEYVPLSDIVTVISKIGFSSVKRENGIQLISVTGEIDEDNVDAIEEIEKQLRIEILPKIEQDFGVSSEFSGLAKQESDFLADAQFATIISMVGIFLTLCWVFSSWARPLVIMLIIPFGLVGTIYGHNTWDVPMSMFSIIGLIGMTGIIINDSIVLVTTIDEYAEDRGLIPAIIDGTCDRLRPVILTSLTTILGLAPLLFETSRHAQFLRPTVITLTYGLGFGLLLVLLIVPSLIAVQSDIQKQVVAFRRSLSLQKKGQALRITIGILSLLVMISFSTNLGAYLYNGSLPELYQRFIPFISQSSGIFHAFSIFMLSVCLLLALSWLIAVLLHVFLRKKSF
ncbi:MAG: efflux RND transporter permease subunit [Rhodobacterales bacterium]|jgi:multidrug efflux pump subunit AcrB|tara:strand:+ start:933 stop:4334 length:3402 start_codon:yes stop_codon:yes gene_type:complete